VKARVEVQGTVNLQVSVTRGVVIPVVVMGIARSYEKMNTDRVDINHTGWPVDKGRTDCRCQVDRRKQLAAQDQAAIPVAGDENTAARSPAVSIWHPNMVQSEASPMAGTPDPVAAGNPAARNPEMILCGSFCGRSSLKTCRRLLYIVHLTPHSRLPET
jgi:hypothetical protein